MLSSEKIQVSAFAFAAVIAAAAFSRLPAWDGSVIESYIKGVCASRPAFHSRMVRGVSFENYSGKVNLIVSRYLKAGHPPPAHFPAHTIEWTSGLIAPGPGEYGFRIDSSHPAKLSLGGEKILAGPGESFVRLDGGAHEFVLKFFNDDGPRGLNTVNRQLKPGRAKTGIPVGRLELAWKPPWGDGWEPVPEKAFSAPGTRASPAGSPAAWILLLAAAAAAAMAALNPRLYRKAILENRAGIAAACVVVLGFALRWHQHAEIPVYIETWDEIGVGWAGWSLINWRVPVSWSLLHGAYGAGRPAVEWFGTGFNIVSPFFDHPPLFQVLAGAAAIIRGADCFLRVSVSDMRILPVFFSSAAVLLIYLVMKIFYSRRTALLAAFLYAVIPTAVVSGRVVEEDNMLLLMVMLALLFYAKSLDRNSWKAALPVAVFTGLGALAKFTGAGFIGGFALLYLFRGRRKESLAVLAGGGAFALLYFAYGAAVDWGMFARVFAVQAEKLPQLALPARMAFQPKLLETVFWDGGVLFLWFSAPALVFVRKGGFSRDMGVLFGAYFMMISVSVFYDRDYGWYRIIMFPFLAAAGGMMLDELLKTRSVLIMVFFTGLAVMLNLQAVLPGEVLASARLPKILAAGLLLPVLGSHAWDTPKWRASAMAAVLTALFIYAATSVIMVADFADMYYGAPWWSGVL